MNKNDINTLREAVKRSPENIALRLSLALKLFKVRELDESEKNYQQVLKIDPENIKAKQGLIELYYSKGNYSTVIVIAEELANRNLASEKIMELQVKSLLKQNSHKEAQEIYNKMLDRNPFYFDEELDSVLADDEEYSNESKEKSFAGEDEFEGFGHMGDLKIPDFINNPEIMFLPKIGNGFEDMVGRDDIKQTLEMTYLVDELDEETKEKYKLKNCSSLLLYGPPGCGKSYTVSCIPMEFEEDVMPFDWSRISDDSQSVRKDFILPFYFNMARMEAPLTLHLDRVEDIIGSKNPDAHLFQSQFAAEMDAAYRYNQDLFVIACSTAVWHLDPSMLRGGRFDDCIFVAPPTREERKLYFEAYFEKLDIKIKDLDGMVEASELFSFSDLRNVCDKAVLKHIASHLPDVKQVPKFTSNLFLKQILEAKATTLYWFDQIIHESSNAFKSTQIYHTVTEYLSNNQS